MKSEEHLINLTTCFNTVKTKKNNALKQGNSSVGVNLNKVLEKKLTKIFKYGMKIYKT